jgi:hypothetical protein
MSTTLLLPMGSSMNTTTIGRNLAIAGAVCQLGPVIGVAGTVIGMMGAFDTLGTTPGVGDPARLSESIGHVLVSTAIGLVVGIIGLILLTVSVTACRYRAEWFFWFLVVDGVQALSAFPVGSAFGVFFLVYCLTRRQEFLRPATDTLQAPATVMTNRDTPPNAPPPIIRPSRWPYWVFVPLGAIAYTAFCAGFMLEAWGALDS